MTRDELLKLAERVEGLSGRPRNSSRSVEHAKIDCEIWLALNGIGDNRKFRKFIRHRKSGTTEYGAWSARTDRGDVSIFSAPSFTYSLDAAMQLVPTNGFGSLIAGTFKDGSQGYVAVVTKPARAEAEARSAPLAVTAAALRSIASGEGE